MAGARVRAGVHADQGACSRACGPARAYVCLPVRVCARMCCERVRAHRSQNARARCNTHTQLEVVLSFFVGFYRDDGGYEDNIALIALRNFASPTRFWFRSWEHCDDDDSKQERKPRAHVRTLRLFMRVTPSPLQVPIDDRNDVTRK